MYLLAVCVGWLAYCLRKFLLVLYLKMELCLPSVFLISSFLKKIQLAPLWWQRGSNTKRKIESRYKTVQFMCLSVVGNDGTSATITYLELLSKLMKLFCFRHLEKSSEINAMESHPIYYITNKCNRIRIFHAIPIQIHCRSSKLCNALWNVDCAIVRNEQHLADEEFHMW